MGCVSSKVEVKPEQVEAGASPPQQGRRRGGGRRDSIAYNKKAMKIRQENAHGNEHAPQNMVEVIQ